MPLYNATSHALQHEPLLSDSTNSLRGRRQSSIATPSISVILILAVISLALGQRIRVVHLIPAAALVYAALGVTVDDGLPKLGKIEALQIVEKGKPVLFIEGTIVGPRGRPSNIAALRLAIEDAGGREVYHWTVAAPKAALKAGETASFRAKLDAPPTEGEHVSVRFALPGDDDWLPPS